MNTGLRVCILNDNYYRGSGITKVVQRMARTSPFRQFDLYLAGCNYLAGHQTFLEDTDIVSPDRYRCFSLMSKGPAVLPELRRFASWIRSFNCDLVHVHHRRLAALVNVLAPLTGIPVLFTGHLIFQQASWFRAFAPRVMSAVSPSVVEYLRQNKPASDVTLIYNPFDFPRKNTRPPAAGPLRAISIGRLESVKRHQALIEAWSSLKTAGIEAYLDIYGEGALRGPLESLIAERGLTEHVRLCGYTDDLAQRIGSYSFNILVSEKEGFPNAVVESASRGLPTLLTDVSGSRDTLPPSGLALPNCVTVGDADQLNSVLQYWLTHPELIAQDGACFYDYLKPLCSSEEIGERYAQLYAKVLA